MLALAAGASLTDLRGLVSESLFALLSSLSDASGDRALTALKDRFEFDAEEFDLEEEANTAVYGASLVNFPLKGKKIPARGRARPEAARPVHPSVGVEIAGRRRKPKMRSPTQPDACRP